MLVLLSALMLILAACGQKDEPKEEAAGGADEGKKTLRVLTEGAYPPFNYLNGDKLEGFDIDFIELVAKEAGYEYKLENIGWDPIFVEIEGKKADLAVAAVTIDDDRSKTYDFSVPYFLSTNKILVPEGSDITSAADLEGKRIAVQMGTTGEKAVDKLLGKNNKNVKKFETNVLAIQELLSGGADAVVADNTVIEEHAAKNPDQKLIVISDDGAFEQEFYGVLFPKGSELKADFDKALNTVFENGSYAKLYEEWFGSEPDIEILKAQQ